MPSERYRVSSGRGFRLEDFDPADTGGLKDKREARDRLAKGRERLRELQEVLYAHDRYALLLIFQAMDAAGKDSVIEHVMSGVNPQGCQVFAFKQPSGEELDHDFLWRTSRALPERGRIGIFNRSYYEEVLIVRVHPKILQAQRVPDKEKDDSIWKHRFESINDLERHLGRNGTVVRKFFLNVSRETQRRRFLSRLDEPQKNWKFSLADVEERRYWERYMEAYEDAIRHTSTDEAPWYVVPADHKWYTRIVVADAIVDTLEDLDLHYPKVDEAKRSEREKARQLLESEG
jgi:PPK2 family polyphosphate:nucleotide phosphotransferase